MNLTQRFSTIFIISLLLAINAITLMRFPAPSGDEAWMSSRALEIIQSGSSFGSLDRGVLNQYEGYENFNPWISSAIQSLGIRLFGTPSLLAIRFVSLIVGFILLAAVYCIGTTLDGWKLGLLSAAFTTFSWPFLFSAHLGRPDIIVAAFGYTGIALYLLNRNAKIWITILVGLITALAIEVHPNGAIYSLTIAALFFYQYKWSIFRKSDFWGFIAGGAIGVIIYLSLHVFPNPSAFLRLNQIVFSFTHIPPLFTGDLHILLQAVASVGLILFYTFPQIILGFWAIYRFRKVRPVYLPMLLVINAALIISYTLLVRNIKPYYSIHLSPGLSMLIAAFFNDLLNSPARSRFEYGFRVLLVVLACLFPTVKLLRSNPLPNYQKVQSKVNQAIPLNSTIMGNQLYWFGLREHEYFSWENLVFYRRIQPGSSLEDAFRFLHPDYFILDRHVREFTIDGFETNNYILEFGISKSELDDYLNRYADLDSIIEEEGGYLIEIYHIDWEDQSSFVQ